MKHSEVAAKLAIEGAVAAIAGTVKGQLGLTPRVLNSREKIDLGMSDAGNTMYYEVGDSGVFFHTDGAHTTIWYINADSDKGLSALEAQIKRHQPDAKLASDEPHSEEPGFNIRTYDIKLQNNHLAIVDVIYAKGRVQQPRFMVRVSAMARQN
ncbi:MAG: hypothetical protein AB7T59_18615 [Hyphomonadaceae bacterium]